MDDRKEVLPLRVVAARFISMDDQAGLAELDRITAEAWHVIQKRYWLLSTSFTATASATVATLLSAIALTWSETPGAEIVTLIGLGCFGSMLAVAASWRVFQYGGMKAAAPQKPTYADVEDPAARNLERLFVILQRESTPRAFYFARNSAAACREDERVRIGANSAAIQPDQESGIQSAELRGAYRRALLAMPRRTRRIFLMHRLKGMSYRVIAEQLGIGEKGIDYHMMKALSRCRRAAARLE